MTDVQLGGIDPSILRELSGVYKPFVKALKELVSNAFDADADHVHIAIADDFASTTVPDDGEGMTPFEFRKMRVNGHSRLHLCRSVHKHDTEADSCRTGSAGYLPLCKAVHVISRGCAFVVIFVEF